MIGRAISMELDIKVSRCSGYRVGEKGTVRIFPRLFYGYL